MPPPVQCLPVRLLLMILASDVRLKIFADAFSLWENRSYLSTFDIRKNMPKGLRYA